jgi:hypothetical protein
MRRELLASAGILLAFGAGCGGNDPFQVLGDASVGTSQGLNLPVDPNLIQTVTPFSSSQDGIGIGYNSGFGTTATVSAPLAGLVVNVDNTLNPGFVAITIYHNARLTSRLAFLQITTVRQGDFVNTGDIIASIPSSGFGLTGLKLSVFVDGASTATCPFSYLSQTARTTYTQKFGSAFPCLQ